jgi:hypothetical protein
LIVSALDGKENGVISQRLLFSGDSANKGRSLKPGGPLPGPKSIRLAKKGGGSSFPDAGFRRFRPAVPWLPSLFAEAKKREQRRVLPALFGFGACFPARATGKRD